MLLGTFPLCGQSSFSSISLAPGAPVRYTKTGEQLSEEVLESNGSISYVHSLSLRAQRIPSLGQSTTLQWGRSAGTTLLTWKQGSSEKAVQACILNCSQRHTKRVSERLRNSCEYLLLLFGLLISMQ